MEIKWNQSIATKLPHNRKPHVLKNSLFTGIALLMTLVILSSRADADHAHFNVTGQVINSDLQPFTATINRMGNGHRLTRGGSFEPQVFRTMLQATEDADNRIIASANVISGSDKWRSGAFDGAEVEILRIVDGKFQSIRTDRVADGGHQNSGWLEATPRGKVLPAGQTTYDFKWDTFNRPDAPYYFTVRAVNRRGKLSPAAEYVQIRSPEKIAKTGPLQNRPPLKTLATSGVETTLSPPADLSARLTEQGTIRLEWSAVKRAAGYVVYRSDYPPSEHLGSYIELEGSGAKIKVGDLVFLRMKTYDVDRSRYLSNRVWSASAPGHPFKVAYVPWADDPRVSKRELVPHTSDTPVSTPGETFLRLTLDEGQSWSFGAWNHSGLAQDWYTVLEPNRSYRFEVWMRSRSIQDLPQDVTFEVTGFYEEKPAQIEPIQFTLTPEWRKYEGTFTPTVVNAGRQAGKTELHVTGPGVFDIDNFRVFAADTPFLSLPKDDVARLRDSKMGALRTHGFIKTGQATYDLPELTNPAGVTNIGGGNTLPQTLGEIARVGMSPWLQIEPHFTRDEWLGLVEYLAAPYDPTLHTSESRPWAAKRYAQGHSPWVDQFDSVFFEIGNETWSRLFAPWRFPKMTDAKTGAQLSSGAVYGLYQEYVLEILRGSPYWPDLQDKLKPVIGGWAGFDYGVNAAALSPNTMFMTQAAYNGGWDENAGVASPTPEGFFSILTHAVQMAAPRAERYRNAARELSVTRDTSLLTGTYEAGPGYVLNGLNGRKVSETQAEQQERAMKSVAAGTATLDAFLTRAERGHALQNYFTYGSGRYWTSHARWNKGGQTYPAWDLLSLFNREALGDMLKVDAVDVPTVNLAASGRRDRVRNAPMIATYATRTENKLVVIVVSRHVPGISIAPDQTTSITLDLPITSAEHLTIYNQSGTLESHNVDRQGSQIVARQTAVPETLPRLEIPTLPPGEVLIYVFDGT